MPRAEGRCPGLSAGQAAASSAPHALSLLLLLLLACCANACRGMPTSPQRLQQEKELQLWNEINEACSSFLSIDSQPQEQNEKDNTKRFLFHYSKIQKSGNSNVVEEFRSPFTGQSRGYFLFRPRNGKRSAGII